jgi:DNA-binding transcriptional ArsR family regulator
MGEIMKLIIENKPNIYWEASAIVKKILNREKGDPAHIIENKDRFILSEDEINQKYSDLIEFYERVFDESLDVLKDYPEWRELFSIQVDQNDMGFFETVTRFTNAKEVDELSKTEFFNACHYHLQNIEAEQEDLDGKTLKEMKDRAFDSDYYIEKIMNSELDNDEKIKMMDLFQNADERFKSYVNLIKRIEKIYLKYYGNVEHYIRAKVESFSSSGKANVKNTPIVNYIDVERWNLRSEEPIHLYFSIINKGTFGMSIINDESIRPNMILGILFEELRALLNKGKHDAWLFIEQMKALGEENRFNIMKLLSQKPYYLKEIADTIGLTSATVSHHMEQLTKTELVYMATKGRKVYYYVNDKKIKKLAELFNQWAKGV